jgi:formylglycine-generating enzyme required for sulfatase activity
MGQGRGASVTAAIVMLSLAASAARADDTARWIKDRQARFEAYRAVHPNPYAEVATLKMRTAALVAMAGPIGGLQAAVDRTPVSWPASDHPIELWDGADDPDMIVVPAGEFSMGSKVGEYDHRSWETPRHRVRLGYSFAVGKGPVTVGEFARFVADTGYDAGDQCFTSEGDPQPRMGRNWRSPSFDQTGEQPAGCLNYADAQAYIAWLSKKTGHAYRLLSEAEAEYVNRAGSTTVFWWGDDPTEACAFANGADADALAHFPQLTANTCRDGYVFASPIGRFKPNAFGLYDTTGNVWSWLADCWNETYDGAPTDGSANLAGDCSQRLMRGGSWSARPALLRSALRIRYPVAVRVDDHGFRVARTL